MHSKGLLKLPFDPRDFSHHDHFGSLGISQLPDHDFTVYESFKYIVQKGDTLSLLASKFGCTIKSIVDANGIKNPNLIFINQILTIPERAKIFLNQLNLDFCTAFTTVELQYLIFGNSFDPLWQMAKIKQIIGNYSSYGASLRDAASSVVKFGSLLNHSSPYTYNGTLGDKTRDFLANWANYPKDFDKSAQKYKDLSYFSIDGSLDSFDNIRSALYQHRQQRQAVSFGLGWHPEWTEADKGIIPDIMPNSQGEGHNMAIIGQKTINGKLYLVFQQSWGVNAGDGGLYYFPRSIVNKLYTEGYGAFIFSRYDASGLKSPSFIGSLLEFLTSIFK